MPLTLPKAVKIKYSVVSAAILFILLITAFYRFNLLKSFASSSWSQTDWSGGTTSGTITTDVNTYESASNVIVSTSGQITLAPKSDWAATLSNWNYRAPITVTNSGTELIDYPIVISLDTQTYINNVKMETDCKDLRLTDALGNELPTWIETGKNACNTSNTYVWTKLATLPTGDTTIYLYYGNASATNNQNGSNVFDFFDDFEDDSIDNTKWTQGVLAATSGTNFSESGGVLTGGNTNRYIQSANTFSGNYIAEARVYEDISAGNGYTSVGFYSSSSNSWGILIHNGTTYLRNNGSWPNFGSFSRDKWTRDKVSVIGTAGYAERVAEDGSETRTYSNTNSGGISNEYLRLSTRFDNGAYNQNYTGYWDWIFVRKAVSTEPTASTPGTEEKFLPSTGSLTSNIFDTSLGSAWETYSYNALTPTNTSVTVELRAGNNSDMSDASSWTTCASGIDITTTCVLDNTRYLQYRINLNSADNLTSPTFEDIIFSYSPFDSTPPTTNASNIIMYTSNGGRSITSGEWNNTEGPYFTWTAGTDNAGGTGIRGYCLYLGSDSGANPETSKGLLGTSPENLGNSTCGFIISTPYIDLSTSGYIATAMTSSNSLYYLKIKAIDYGDNVFSGSAAEFQFKEDVTPPTNVSYISCASGSFSNVEDMSFSWPTSGGSASSDANSDLLGWQYQINSSSGTWLGTTTEATLGVDYIPVGNSSYDLTSGQDSSSISLGNNIVYFRAIDNSGNPATDATVRTCNLSYGGDAPSFGGTAIVTITPSTSSSNSFALSWPEANAGAGNSIAKYYYMINTSPPTTLATLSGNASTYISNETNTSVTANSLPNVNKGTNTIYVVAVDNENNYSPSNYIQGTFTLNSTDPDNVENIVASDSSIKSEERWNVTLTWTAPQYEGAGNLTYLIYRSTNGSTFSQVGSTSGLSYVDSTPSSQKYYYKIYSKDGANALSSGTNAVEITPTGRWTTPPSLQSDPTVTNISTKRAQVNWATNRTADSKVQFGTKSGDYGKTEPSDSTQVTSHAIELTGLNPGTKYYYKVKWTDEDGNTGLSDEKVFSTLDAPSVSEPGVKVQGITNVTLQFTTNGATSAKVYYGKSTSFGGTSEIATSTSSSTYNLTLEGLEDGTKYFYKINTFDSDGDEYQGNTLSFETLPRPRISNIKLQQVARTAQSTMLVTWETNTETSSIITYAPQGNPAEARDQVDTSLIAGEHRMLIQGLQPQTNYTLLVSGRDKAGNEALGDRQTFTTSTDSRPPLISDLKIETNIVKGTEGNQTAQLLISWNTDEPATSQVEFGEGTGTSYSQSTQQDKNLTFNHLVIIPGMQTSKVYHLRALSVDKADNLSASIDTVSITPKSTDNALDLVISNLQEAFGFLGNIN